MRNDFLGGDPRKLWQNQPTEPSSMTLEKIRLKARELQLKTRRELFANVAMGLLAVAISSPGMLRAPELGLQLAFALAILWALAGQYFLHQGMWSATLPGDAALSTGFEFYRREIERRRSLLGRVLQWSLGPVALSVGVWILALIRIAADRGLPVRTVIPFSAIFAAWIIAAVIRSFQGQRELQRELDELNNLEKENSR